MFRPTFLMIALWALVITAQAPAAVAAPDATPDATPAAAVDFAKQVQPIFMEHCAGCHGEEKGLGGLRLHAPEAIQTKASKDEHLIVKGKPEESELYQRLVLPADHKKRMPKKADPLPKEKITLIQQWIEQGAVYSVAATVPPADKPAVETTADPAEAHGEDDADHSSTAKPQEIPLPEVDPADSVALEKLTAAGAQVTSLFAGSPLLQVSYALRGEPATDADVALLADVAEQVYSLNLAKAQVSDQGLTVLSKLINLSQLHLEHSSVADSGLSHLDGLASLQYLNLYGTAITDEGMQHLSGLKQLRKLYLWQTKVSYDMAKAMEKAATGLMVDLGYDHPVVVRNRVTKQLEQAKEQAKDSDAEFKQAQEAFDRAKQEHEAVKKRLDELQKKMDELDGKAEPEKSADTSSDDPKADKEQATEAKAAAEKPDDKQPEAKEPDEKKPEEKKPEEKKTDEKAAEVDDNA